MKDLKVKELYLYLQWGDKGIQKIVVRPQVSS